MRATNRRMFRDLVIGLSAMGLATVAVDAWLWVEIGRTETAAVTDHEARNELAEDAAAIQGVTDQETGLRGYVISRNPTFLAPYYRGSTALASALPQLDLLVADDDDATRAHYRDFVRLTHRWTTTVAQPAIEAVRIGGDGQGRVIAGKATFDALRADMDAMRASERRELVRRDARQARSMQAIRFALLLGTLLALAFVGVIIDRMFRRVLAAQNIAAETAVRLEEALEAAHAAQRAKTLFLSNMSHEMRTPLNGVTGMAGALLGTPLDPRQREMVAVIETSAQTLNHLIGDLLILSRGERAPEAAANHQAFSVGGAVRRALGEHVMAARLKGLTLTLDLADDAEAEVRGDGEALAQLLACLLSNAVKFTDTGGVTLSARRDADALYHFEVADTGAGFDAEHAPMLFESFVRDDNTTTRKHGGAGVGLAVAKRLADDMGGRLTCRSQPGVGSVFSFEVALPASDAKPAVAAAAPEAAEATTEDEDAPLRVLVVDDNATNRKVLELILGQIGVESVSVGDGRQAVEAVRAQPFAAILMDIQMPVMDGLAATREIRRRERDEGHAQTPVIIVSANGQPEHIEAGRAAGAQNHLVKPIAPAALVNALNDVLNAQPATQAA